MSNLDTMVKRFLVLALIAMLVVPAGHALAGKKKKPKPWTSEQGTIAIAHPVFYSTSGDIVGVTLQELKNTCAMPVTQGLDAFVVEVPAEYQGIQAFANAVGTDSGAGGYDLDMFFFGKDCSVLSASQATGTDELGYMPAGTAFIGVGNYLADPNVGVQVELKV